MERNLAIVIICHSFFWGYVFFCAGLILPSFIIKMIGGGLFIGAIVGFCRLIGLIEKINWRSE